MSLFDVPGLRHGLETVRRTRRTEHLTGDFQHAATHRALETTCSCRFVASQASDLSDHGEVGVLYT